MSTYKGVIVAGNMLQYFQWLHTHGLNRADYKPVFELKDILGFKDIPAFAVGTCYQLPEFHDLKEYVFSHGMDPDIFYPRGEPELAL